MTMSAGDYFIPYGRQCLDENDISAVVAVLKSDYLTQGPAVKAFESALSEYTGAGYAVVFSSGTAALHAAYFAAGIRPGDEIITSPITFVATANACLYSAAVPVFADVEPDTGNMDVLKIEKKITEHTKLLVPVHYSGHSVDLQAVSDLAGKYNILVIEDACHAFGAEYKGQKIGNCAYSDMTVLSFHPVKHITTGEGGAVLTNKPEYFKRLLMFRSHGISREDFVNEPHGDWYYEMRSIGFNYRMTDIQAALGMSQLKKLDRFVERRREIADIYSGEFKDNPHFDIPPERDYASSSYHLYPVRLKDSCKDKKREIFKRLRDEGIGVQVHYIPVYLHPYYNELGYRKGLCPVAEDFYCREISIPVYPAMEYGDIRRVIEKVYKVFGEL